MTSPTQPSPMRERLVSPSLISKEEESFNVTLRPPTLREYVGQKDVVDKLSIVLCDRPSGWSLFS